MLSFINIAVAISIALLLWSFVHLGFAFYFRYRIVQPSFAGQVAKGSYQPYASVLLSLRGCDPFLEQTLRGLLSQAYRDFELIVIIDSQQDPAWEVACQLKNDFDASDRMRVFPLRSPSKKCSLKCSSLVQATEHLSPESEAVLLIDADVVPHRNWLANAVAPLADPSVGVVTGNQWFEPSWADMGSALRSLWNSGALVATSINANPWAGTCAMRTSDLRESGLIDDWRTSVVDDGPIKGAFASLGLRVMFDPSLIMVNRDRCTLAFVDRYVTRMLTWSRIYEPTFLGTALHAAAMAAFILGPLLFIGAATYVQDWHAFTLTAASMLLTNVMFFIGNQTVRIAVSEAVASRSEELEKRSLARSIQTLMLLPICHLAHVLWTVKAMFLRQVKWRDINYRLLGGQRVEMTSYQPYLQAREGTAKIRTSV